MGDISPSVRRVVLARDKRCVASLIWPHICRDTFGSVHPATDLRRMELDHVREESMMGKEPKSEPAHLVTLCRYAHQASGWATSNREVLRLYLDWCHDGERPTMPFIRMLRPLVMPAPHP